MAQAALVPQWPLDSENPLFGGLHTIYHTDAFDWLEAAPPHSIHAVVTDPPYGLVEYTNAQLAKLRAGSGGVWRMPPVLDGYRRKPVPRFTVLTEADKQNLRGFFTKLASSLLRVLTPGAHVFIATNPLLSYLVYEPFINAGFEKRGEIIRTVTTLRGGDRPKNAHNEFTDITVMPRFLLGALGPLSQTHRGSRTRQPEEMENGSAPPPFLQRTVSETSSNLLPRRRGSGR